MVVNPPRDIKDPDAYRDLFCKYGEVVSVTLALNNGWLLTAIAQKKEVERKLAETVEGNRLLEAEELGCTWYMDQSPLWKRLMFAIGLYEDTVLLWGERERLKTEVGR